MINSSKHLKDLNLNHLALSGAEQKEIVGGRRYITTCPNKFQQKLSELNGKVSSMHITMSNGTYCIEY